MKFALLALLLLVPSMAAPRSSKPGLADLVDRVRPSIVQIIIAVEAPNSMARAQTLVPCIVKVSALLARCIAGTGFFINDRGDILTAAHVTEGVEETIQLLSAASIEAHPYAAIELPNGETGGAKIAWNNLMEGLDFRFEDPQHDLAVLSLTSPDIFKSLGEQVITRGAPKLTPTVVTFDLTRPRSGDEVYAAGYPLNAEDLTTSAGNVGTPWGKEALVTARKNGLTQEIEVYRLDLRANPGNSGGPVFAAANQSVIGIVVETQQNVGGWIAISVPSRYIEEILREKGIPFHSVLSKKN